VIGVGLLVDTFVVRTITVPALAVLVGRGNWWPSGWLEKRRRSKRRVPVNREPAAAVLSKPAPTSAPTSWSWAVPFKNRWLRQS
jgi:hypothetical protein